MPLLSIVMPVKNGMPYIVETISSVLSSDFDDFELIISNDNSIDGTTEYLQSLTDKRIIVTSPPVSMKVDKHWTFVTELATGKYIKLLCADDLVTNGALNRQMSALLSNPESDLVVSSRAIIDKYGNTLIKKHGRAGLKGLQPGVEVLRKCFTTGTNLLGEPSGLIFKSSILKMNLPWNGKYPYMLDFELYSRTLPKSQVLFIESVDSEFRVHGSSISSKEGRSHYTQFLSIYKQVIENNKEFLPLNRFERIQMKNLSYLKTRARQIIFWVANRSKNKPK